MEIDSREPSLPYAQHLTGLALPGVFFSSLFLLLSTTSHKGIRMNITRAPTSPAVSPSAEDSDDDSSLDLFSDEADTVSAEFQRCLRIQRADLARRERLAALPPAAQRTSAQNRTAYVLAGVGGQRLQPTRLAGVLAPDECELVLAAVVDYAGRRGGLQTARHERFATTDVPVADLSLSLAPGGSTTVGEAVLGWVTDRILTPMAEATGFRPRDLGLKDLFVVCYCGRQEEQPPAGGQGVALYPIPSKQASLAIHSDGCLLSFSLLLNSHDAFEGGGTYFEATGETFHVGQGGLLMHDAGLERECASRRARSLASGQFPSPRLS